MSLVSSSTHPHFVLPNKVFVTSTGLSMKADGVTYRFELPVAYSDVVGVEVLATNFPVALAGTARFIDISIAQFSELHKLQRVFLESDYVHSSFGTNPVRFLHSPVPRLAVLDIELRGPTGGAITGVLSDPHEITLLVYTLVKQQHVERGSYVDKQVWAC